MNQQYDNTNRGSLFKNDKKTEEKHPDLSGSINIEGMEYWIFWLVSGPTRSRIKIKFMDCFRGAAQ
jgi:hypothetical protein